MNEIDLIKLLSQSGVAVVALWILGRVVWRVGERMIEAIDKVVTKLDEHTAADLKAVADLRQDVAVLNGRVEQVIDWQDRTPIGGGPLPRETPSPGMYSIPRPGTKGK